MHSVLHGRKNPIQLDGRTRTLPTDLPIISQAGKIEYGTSTLSFVFEPLPYDESSFTIVPLMNGIRLIRLVAQYEHVHGYYMPGAYGGVGRSDFTGEPLEHYRLETNMGSQAAGRRWLLGCTRGVGEATIAKDGQHVIWHEFTQPHRPEQDYSDFGPFVFDAEQYRQAVVEMAQKKHSR